MIRSWDNLTNHGLLRIIPDTLIVHNPFLKRLAMTLHHVPESRIVVVGLPHYDWYTRQDLFTGRDDFFKQTGLDPSKKFILYAGIGDYLAPHDWEVVRILSDAIEQKKIGFPAEILFRPHPAFSVMHREKISSTKHVIFDDRVVHAVNRDHEKGEMGEKEMAHLVNSLRHADVVITTASSMAIDAVAFDRPVICVAFDGISKEPYWNSVLRYYKDFTHYKLITATGGFRVAYGKNEFVRYINEYLQNPSLDADGRKKIFDDFIWKLDGRLAERTAHAVLDSFAHFIKQ